MRALITRFVTLDHRSSEVPIREVFEYEERDELEKKCLSLIWLPGVVQVTAFRLSGELIVDYVRH